MLARSIPCQLAINVQPFRSRSIRFITSSCIGRTAEKRDVSLASYTEESQKTTKDAQRTTLHVNENQQASPEPKDVSRKTVPFDRSLLSKLTPTMRSFTLDGKVAVVTGYELNISFGNSML